MPAQDASQVGYLGSAVVAGPARWQQQFAPLLARLLAGSTACHL